MHVVVRYVGKHIDNVRKQDSDEGRDFPSLGVDQVRLFKPIFGFLNDKDKDILYLIFVSRKKQKDVQRILNRSQSSLCYDIKRIRKRLEFIVYLHSVFDLFLDFVATKSHHFTPIEMEILTLMFYTSSFTQTARVMDLSQVKVRYAYNKCVKRMEDMAKNLGMKDMWIPYEIFTSIRRYLNIIRRTYAFDLSRRQRRSDSDWCRNLPLPL